MPDPTLESLQQTIASLTRAKTTWNGEVRLEERYLPYPGTTRCDMCGGDGLTSDGLDTCYKCDGKCVVPEIVHAIIVDRVLLVSREAWDALKGASEANA
jgi:hypothetical protein